MSYVRCSSCQARRTLAKNIKKYVRLPRCRRCGHDHYYVDHYRTNVERGVKPCNCGRTGHGLYWFPHRRGSKFCEHSGFTVDDARRSRFNSGRDQAYTCNRKGQRRGCGLARGWGSSPLAMSVRLRRRWSMRKVP